WRHRTNNIRFRRDRDRTARRVASGPRTSPTLTTILDTLAVCADNSKGKNMTPAVATAPDLKAEISTLQAELTELAGKLALEQKVFDALTRERTDTGEKIA